MRCAARRARTRSWLRTAWCLVATGSAAAACCSGCLVSRSAPPAGTPQAHLHWGIVAYCCHAKLTDGVQIQIRRYVHRHTALNPDQKAAVRGNCLNYAGHMVPDVRVHDNVSCAAQSCYTLLLMSRQAIEAPPVRSTGIDNILEKSERHMAADEVVQRAQRRLEWQDTAAEAAASWKAMFKRHKRRRRDREAHTDGLDMLAVSQSSPTCSHSFPSKFILQACSVFYCLLKGCPQMLCPLSSLNRCAAAHHVNSHLSEAAHAGTES